jgi:PAS domain S-box-containing protein
MRELCTTFSNDISLPPDLPPSRQNDLDLPVYRQIFENAPDACFLMDNEGLRDCSRAFLDILGYGDKSDVLSRPLAALSTAVQPDGADSDSKTDAVIERAFREASHRFDWSFRRADGTDVAVPVTLRALEVEGHRLLHGVLHEATDDRRLEGALREMARGVSATTGDSFFRSLVEYLARALNADYAFIGELAGEDQSRVRTTAVCVDGRIVPNFEYDLPSSPCANVVASLTGSGTCAIPTGVQRNFPDDPLLAEMSVDGYAGTPLFDSSGHVLGLIVVLYRQPIRNMPIVESTLQVFAARAAAELERRQTERAREQALAALTETEERFKSAFERSSIGMSIVGLDDRFLQVNAALCSLLGYTADELTGLTTAEISNPDDLRELRKSRDNTEHLHAGDINSFQVEKRYRHKQGHYFWALVGVSMVRDADGNLTHYTTQVQDISERKRAEAERTAAMDELKRANEQLEARVRERTAQIEHDRALLETVLRQMPAGVMVAEAPSGRLLLGNEQMTRILRGVTDQRHRPLMASRGRSWQRSEAARI